MAERSTKRSVREISPLFEIPEGTDEFVYDEEFSQRTGEGVSFADEDYAWGSGDFANQSALPVPEMLTVVSETFRTGPGGEQVVDLIVEVEDLPGVTEIEFRVST